MNDKYASIKEAYGKFEEPETRVARGVARGKTFKHIYFNFHFKLHKIHLKWDGVVLTS